MTQATVVRKENHQTLWWVVLIEGSVAVLLGLLLIFFPTATATTLVQFLGIYLIVKAVLSFVSIFQDPKRWGWKLIVGLLGLVAGILLLNHPWWAKLLLPAVALIVIAILAILMGTLSLVQAISGSGWADAVLGLLAIFLGFLLLSQPIGFTLISQPIIATVALPYLFGYLMVGGGLLAILGSLWLFFRSATKKPVEEVPETSITPVRLEEAPVEVSDTRPVAITAALAGEALDAGEDEVLQAEETPETSETPEQAEIGWALEEEPQEEQKPDSGLGPAVLVGAGALASAALLENEEEPAEPEVLEEPLEPELVDAEGPSAEALVAAKLAADQWGAEKTDSEIGEPVEEIAEEVIIDEIPAETAAEPVVVVEETAEAEAPDEPAAQETLLPPADIELADVQKRLLNHDVEYMEGIGPVYAAKLKAIGIATALDLLRQGATRRGRTDIVEKSGISQKLVLKWINQADMYRIRGIGSEYAELLEAAGVDTVVELAARRPENLHPTLLETNDLKKLTRQVPSLTQVKDWIEQAGNLPRVIRY